MKKELDRLLNVFGSRQALIQALRSEDNNWQEDEDSDQPGDLDYILNILGESKKKNECSYGKGKHCSCEASTKQEEDDEVVVPGDVFIDNRSGEQVTVVKIERTGPEGMVILKSTRAGGATKQFPALEFTSRYTRYTEDQERVQDSAVDNAPRKDINVGEGKDVGVGGARRNIDPGKYQVIFADGHKIKIQAESTANAMRQGVKQYGQSIPQQVTKLGEKKVKEALEAEVTPDVVTVENDKYVISVADDRLQIHTKPAVAVAVVAPVLPVQPAMEPAAEEPETLELELPVEDEEAPEEVELETPEEVEPEEEEEVEPEEESKKRPFESRVIEAVDNLVFLHYIIIGRTGKQTRKYTIDRSKLINWLELDDAEGSIPEKEWNQFEAITGFLTCADMSLKAIIRSLKTNKLPLKIAHEEGAIGIANNAQEAQKAATDIYMESETGSFDESKVNESYSNSDIAKDLKAGVPKTAVVARIIKRYTDIGQEQAQKIVKAVQAGKPVDWSHRKEKATDESKTKVPVQFRSKMDNKKAKKDRKIRKGKSKKVHETQDHDLWDAIIQKVEGQESEWEPVVNLIAQVGNGGFEQWITNGYAKEEGKKVQWKLAKIGTDTAEKVAELADQAMAYTEEDIYGDVDPDSGEGEDTEIMQKLDGFDDAFYAGLNDQLVKDLAAKLGIAIVAEPKVKPEAQ